MAISSHVILKITDFYTKEQTITNAFVTIGSREKKLSNWWFGKFVYHFSEGGPQKIYIHSPGHVTAQISTNVNKFLHEISVRLLPNTGPEGIEWAENEDRSKKPSINTTATYDNNVIFIENVEIEGVHYKIKLISYSADIFTIDSIKKLTSEIPEIKENNQQDIFDIRTDKITLNRVLIHNEIANKITLNHMGNYNFTIDEMTPIPT